MSRQDANAAFALSSFLQGANATYIEQRSDHSDAGHSPLLEGEIKDDRLRLMFACCHPLVPPESQAALALKTLCGFSSGELGRRLSAPCQR